MFLLPLLLQAAAPAAPAPPERFSILVPVANQSCARRGTVAPADILVCADPLPEQALPLPAEATSPDARPVNRDVTGTGALAAASTPCAARMGGCQVGVDVFGGGTAVVRAIQKLVSPDSCCEEAGEATSPALLGRDAVNGVKRLFAEKPDHSGREPIRLDDGSEGRLLP